MKKLKKERRIIYVFDMEQ